MDQCLPKVINGKFQEHQGQFCELLSWGVKAVTFLPPTWGLAPSWNRQEGTAEGFPKQGLGRAGQRESLPQMCPVVVTCNGEHEWEARPRDLGLPGGASPFRPGRAEPDQASLVGLGIVARPEARTKPTQQVACAMP